MHSSHGTQRKNTTAPSTSTTSQKTLDHLRLPASLSRLRGPLNAATRRGTVRPGSGSEALSAAASPCDNILSKQPINNLLTQVCGWKQPGKTQTQRAPLRHSRTAVGHSICVNRQIQWGCVIPWEKKRRPKSLVKMQKISDADNAGREMVQVNR